MKYVDIYCIGVSDSSHIGAWAALLRYKNKEKIIRGKIENTNEIRATMIAVIKGLECLKEPCNVTVYTQLTLFRKRSNWDGAGEAIWTCGTELTSLTKFIRSNISGILRLLLCL